MSHLTSAEADCNLYSVPMFQKLLGLIDLGFKVVCIDFQRQTNFFNFHCLLLFLCFFLAFGLLKAILAVVHNFAHRRYSFRRNVDEIQIFLACQLQSIPGAHNAQRAAICADDADFLLSDFFIDRHFLFANGKAPPKHLK